MPEPLVSDLVELITDKQVADPGRPEAYIGLEHIPERAMRIVKVGDTETIRGMCVRFCEGDILFGKLRPNLRKSVLAPVDGLGSTEILVLRPKAGVDPSFAGHVLRSETVFFEAERMTEGTRMPRTSWKTLGRIEVSAPSDQSAQKLIADILDAIDDSIFDTDAVIDKLQAVSKGWQPTCLVLVSTAMAISESRTCSRARLLACFPERGALIASTPCLACSAARGFPLVTLMQWKQLNSVTFA